MPVSPLGRTLVIANPAAHSGDGEKGARFARNFLGSYASATKGYELRLTGAPGDAERMARAARAEGFDTVVALGGDGVIHEAVNGLMALPVGVRPQLGIIPLGSGNDFARTLGLSANDVEAAFAQLVRGHARRLDIGRVNGVHFMQTLSFGIDAAIAHDTTARRAADSSLKGEALYATSALRILPGARHGWPCKARFDGGEARSLRALIFAVQLGPTYGGGFRICPDADPADGLFDVCYNVKRPALPHLLALFGLARSGRHAASKVVELRRARRIELEFEGEPPAQTDGEPLRGTRFEVELLPQALRVICPTAPRARYVPHGS